MPPGPNDLQSFPILTSVASSGTSTSIQGTLQGLQNTTFLIQFFSNTATTSSGYGEGQTPIGSVMVTTDPVTGLGPFATTVGSVVPQDLLVTATATVVTGNDQYSDTSAFSKAFSSIPIAVQFDAPSFTVDQAAGTMTIGVMRTTGSNPGTVLTVAYATGGGTAQPGVNYTTTTGTLTLYSGVMDQSFVVPIISTNMVGPDTTVNLTLSNPTGGATVDAPNPVTLTIENNNQLTMQFMLRRTPWPRPPVRRPSPSPATAAA